jgi:hypothetical protein
MTRPLPFTKASITRRILGVRDAGLHVVGIAPDGTLIVAENPINPSSLVPAMDAQERERHAENGGGA